MTAPGNPLEHALAAAATEPAARPLFYRLLLESPLLVLDASSSPPVVDEKTLLQKGTEVQAVCVDIGGVPHTVVFTSLVVLQSFVRAEHKYLSMLGRDLLNLVRGSHLILNPGADFGKQIVPEEIEAVLSGAAIQGYATHTVEKETQVLLGQPAHFPTHVTDALSAVFRPRKEVRAAYLALCSWPESGKQHLLVGIDVTGDWSALMRDATTALAAAAHPDDVVDFVRMDDSSFATYLRETRPFYKKKLLGLF